MGNITLKIDPAGSRGVIMLAFRNNMLFGVLLLLLSISVDAAVPSASVSPSRTSGKAPLLVFFNATATTDADTAKPVHHLTYCFDAGDGNTDSYSKVADLNGSDIWTKTTKKAEFCGAPFWAYVYETPGSYTMTLRVIDKDGNADTTSVDVTVGAYTGAETTCISTSGNFTGCPSGAEQHTSSDLDASVETECLSANGDIRCLFRAGETFTASATVDVSISQTGVHIGSYGNSGVGDGKFIIASSSDPVWRWDGDDGRLTDGSYPSGANTIFIALDKFTTDTDNVLLQNWDMDTVAAIISHTHGTAATDNVLASNFGMFDLDATNCTGYDICVFTEIKGMAIVNSLLDGGAGNTSHVVRIAHGEELWIHGNKIMNSANTRHLLTLRAFDWTGEPSGNENRWSENVFVSDNWFSGNSGWPVQVGIGGNPVESRHRNYIFERNFGNDRGTGNPVQQCFIFGGGLTSTVHENFTMRNNICDGTGFTTAPHSMFTWGNALSGTGYEFINNSFYSDGSGSTGRFLNGTLGCNVAVNNLYWDADAASTFNSGTACTTQANNFKSTTGGETGVGNLSQCPYSACPPTNLDDFKIKSSDPDNLVNGGTSVANLLDFNQNVRPSGASFDVGSWEFATATTITAQNPRVTSVTP